MSTEHATPGQAMHVTDEDFEIKVLKSERPVIVDFWAAWCAPCKMIAPALDEIAREYVEQLTVGKLDVDSNHGTAIRYGVQSIPTLILFKNGQETERLVGFMQKKDIVARVKPHLG